VRKISPPPGFDPRTVQPLASRYTDYASRPIVVLVVVVVAVIIIIIIIIIIIYVPCLFPKFAGSVRYEDFAICPYL
jgi:hypothetical protein